LVDPCDLGKSRRLGWSVPELVWIGMVGGVEDFGALAADLAGGTVVDQGWGVCHPTPEWRY